MERALAEAGFAPVAGVDEVGRGALAGPLYACAVMLASGTAIQGLRDSKQLTAKQRERIAIEIRTHAIAWSMVRVMPGSIDRRGLHKSNLWALRRAVLRLEPRPGYVLTDGFHPPRLPIPALSIKKGDQISASVAAASVLAKVARDAAMVRMARRYPEYGFERNAGYGTPEHLDALRRLGPSPVHRMSFEWSGRT
ncbi:MAG: ribonuclease HII [Actinomycetota bacterium]